MERPAWSDLHFALDTGTGYRISSELRPDDFITFVKADFFKADMRGLVNALSNAKRAIDCQADNFLMAIGFDPDRLDKQLGAYGLDSLAFGGMPTDTPLKFRLLRALGIATPEIIARLRRLRNLLEHDYKKPRRADVSNAIDFAELFVQAGRGKMLAAFDTIWFGSGKVKVNDRTDFEKGFCFSFQNETEPKFEVTFLRHDHHKLNPKQKPPSTQIGMRDEGFVPLLKLVWHTDWDNDMTEALRNFLFELGIKLPNKLRVRRDL